VELKERIDLARSALATFRELVGRASVSAVERDAAIQRFEYSFEAMWKAARAWLHAVEGLEPGSPKGVIRACRQVDVLDDEAARLALEMVDDRSLTVHAYNEKLARVIYERLADYASLMTRWLETMAARAS